MTDTTSSIALMNRLMPLEQQIFLSMLGPAAWRTYRQTATPVSMVLPLFATPDPWDATYRGAHEQLRALRDCGVFPAGAALETWVQHQLTAAASTVPWTYEIEGGMLRAVLYQLFDYTGADMPGINSLASMMLNSLDRYFPLEELAPHAAIWFELCDMALGGTALVAGGAQ